METLIAVAKEGKVPLEETDLHEGFLWLRGVKHQCQIAGLWQQVSQQVYLDNQLCSSIAELFHTVLGLDQSAYE